MSLMVDETYVNATEGYIFGGTEAPQEAYTDTLGELFRSCQQEFGRCVSKMYRDDHETGEPRQVGWVFQKVMTYEDDRSSTYLREVWVEVYSKWEKTVSIKAEHPFGAGA